MFGYFSPKGLIAQPMGDLRNLLTDVNLNSWRFHRSTSGANVHGYFEVQFPASPLMGKSPNW